MPLPKVPLRTRRMQDSIMSLGPDGEEHKVGENLEELQRTMKHGDMQDPRQQAILKQEQQRLQQAKQQFTQRLQQRLNPRIGTPEDSDPQAARAAFMARLMSKMRSGMAR